MKYIYNKLVRDKIPQEINNVEGRKADYRILNDEEYIKELDKKLLEEAHEFIEEHSIEELGDLMEVIFSIMKLEKIETHEVEKSRIDKKNKKGGFDNKIYLNFVEQDKPDEKEEQELKKKWRNNNA